MSLKPTYSVQVDLPGKKEPVIMNRLTRNQYGINMKKLWNNYILMLVDKKQNEQGNYFLKFKARKWRDLDEYILHGRGQGEDIEIDHAALIRDYQEGW